MTELPTGTVTFLFTDLEGSTRLWEEHPEAMRAALARHDAILRGAVGAHAGHIVKSTGDGLHAAFASPADAVGAAVEAQRALVAEQWGAPEPLRVRMGVHTGVAEHREGDYYGPAVNRAARLMSAAHGSQVVVSLATEELVRDGLSGGVGLLDLGEHQLRDVARPERVFQVTHPDLPRDLPPLRSGTRVPGNVPVPVTTFVGRETELARVAELVVDGPLVTLIGVGGVGKTRLALHVAAEVAPQFRDGAWFCDLASVTEYDGIPLAVATALAVAPRTGRPLGEALLDFLRAKDLLLVLDNCEHLVEAAGTFAEQVVRSCPRVRLLATSREALAVDGERLWPVRPLPVPDDAADVDRAAASATVRLFVDRVTAFRPEFRLERTNLGPVVDICRRLDGIPLALELAAARARSMSPADIAARLDRRFALLTGGRRRAVARHETLRAAVDWSYELLDDAERRVLQRVAVFAGGFTQESAEAVAGDLGGEADVFDVVTSLVDKSLVVADESAGTTRYRLLETMRQYALERLDTAGDTDEARDRHLAYFVDFAERAGGGLLTADEATWVMRTRAELDNLRAAVAWAAETGQVDGALRLSTALSTQIYFRQAWNVGALADTALTTPDIADHALYPLALGCAGDQAFRRGDFDAAVALANQTLELVGEAEGPAYRLAEVLLGGVSLFDSRDDAAPHLERALASARRSGTRADVAFCQQLYACTLPSLGREHLEQALTEAEEALKLAQTTGSPSVIAVASFAVGYVRVLRRDPTAGDALIAALEGGAEQAVSGTLGVLALHRLAHGTPVEAMDSVEAAVRDAVHMGDRAMAINTIDFAIPLFIRHGDPVVAAVLVAAMENEALPRVVRTGVPGERRASGLARLESLLGADELLAARARAGAMAFDDVIAFTLNEIARLRARLAVETTHG